MEETVTEEGQQGAAVTEGMEQIFEDLGGSQPDPYLPEEGKIEPEPSAEDKVRDDDLTQEGSLSQEEDFIGKFLDGKKEAPEESPSREKIDILQEKFDALQADVLARKGAQVEEQGKSAELARQLSEYKEKFELLESNPVAFSEKYKQDLLGPLQDAQLFNQQPGAQAHSRQIKSLKEEIQPELEKTQQELKALKAELFVSKYRSGIDEALKEERYGAIGALGGSDLVMSRAAEYERQDGRVLTANEAVDRVFGEIVGQVKGLAGIPQGKALLERVLSSAGEQGSQRRPEKSAETDPSSDKPVADGQGKQEPKTLSSDFHRGSAPRGMKEMSLEEWESHVIKSLG